MPGLDGAVTVHVNSFSCPGAMLSPPASSTRFIPQVVLSFGLTAPRRTDAAAVQVIVPRFLIRTLTEYC